MKRENQHYIIKSSLEWSLATHSHILFRRNHLRQSADITPNNLTQKK